MAIHATTAASPPGISQGRVAASFTLLNALPGRTNPDHGPTRITMGGRGAPSATLAHGLATLGPAAITRSSMTLASSAISAL